MYRRSLFLALVILFLYSLPAAANVMGTLETWNFTDSATIFPDWGNGVDDSKDVIGIPDLLRGEATVLNASGSYYLQSVTLFFTATTNESIYPLLSSGDLFINTNGDTTWDNSVALGGASAGSVAVYDNLGLAYDAATGYVMASMPGYDIREGHPIGVDYAALGETPDGTAQFSGLPAWPGPGTVASLTISGLNIAFDDLVLGYTVSCANDVLFENVNPRPCRLPWPCWASGFSASWAIAACAPEHTPTQSTRGRSVDRPFFLACH